MTYRRKTVPRYAAGVSSRYGIEAGSAKRVWLMRSPDLFAVEHHTVAVAVAVADVGHHAGPARLYLCSMPTAETI
jgi:hypothetical protein